MQKNISEIFKQKKFILLNKDEILHKRKDPYPEDVSPFKANINKTLKLDKNSAINDFLKPKDYSNKMDIDSKTTISTIPSKSNKDLILTPKKNYFNLSSKTKNLINNVLQKKIAPIKKNNESNLMLANNLECDLSVGNSFEIYNKKDEEPKLSDKTLNIIEKLKQKRKNRFEREENNSHKFSCSENSHSTLKFKYEELVKENRELPLPISYKKLFNSFNSLETCINFNKLKSSSVLNTFSNIKTNIESTSKKKFDLKIFQQILFVVPNFYIYKFNNKELVIDIPKNYNELMEKNYEPDFNFLKINYKNDENFDCINKPLPTKDINKRKKIFKNILIKLVNEYHLKFLKKNNFPFLDAMKLKTWHSKFDLNKEVEEIPIFEIPQFNSKNKIFEQIIENNDIKNQILNDALSIVLEPNEKKETNTNLNKYVSKEFLNKLRNKEKVNILTKEILNYNYLKNKKVDFNKIYFEILTQIKTFIKVNNKNYPLDEIADLVYKSSDNIKNNFVNVDEIKKVIFNLCKKYNNIFQVIKHSTLGYMIVMNNLNVIIPNEISL